jgi:hypothetical protein
MLTGKQELSRNAERTKGPTTARRCDRQRRSHHAHEEGPCRRGAWPTGREGQGRGLKQKAAEENRPSGGRNTVEIDGPRIVQKMRSEQSVPFSARPRRCRGAENAEGGGGALVKKPPKKKSTAKARPPVSPAKAEKKSAITKPAHEFPAAHVSEPTARITSMPAPPTSDSPKPWHHRTWQTLVAIFRRNSRTKGDK